MEPRPAGSLNAKTLAYAILCTGFCFHWTWVYSIMFSSHKALSTSIGGGFETPSILFAVSSFCGICVVLIGMGIAGSRGLKSSLRGRTFAVLASGIIAGVGTFIFLFASIAASIEPPAMLSLIPGLLTGCGSGCLLLFWGYAFSPMRQASVVLISSLSLILSILLSYLIGSFMVAYAFSASISILPIAEGILLALALRLAAQRNPLGTDVVLRTGKRHSLKSAAVLIVLGFSLSTLRELALSSLPLGTDPFNLMVLFGSLFFALFSAMLILYLSAKRNAPNSLLAPVPLVAAAVALLLLIGDQDLPAYKIVGLVGYFCLEVIVWSLILTLAEKRGGSPFFALGIPLGLLYVGQFICPLTNGFVASVFDSLTLNQVAEPVMLLFALLSATYLMSTGGSSDNVSEIREPCKEPASERIPFDEAIAKLAGHYALSSREMEVLAELLKGRSISRISDTLYISENTTKTHLKRIYKKLNVHSKQEILDLIDVLSS